MTYKIFMSLIFGVLIVAASLPIVFLIIYFNKSFLLSILLAFFYSIFNWGMTDVEIGKMFNTSRSTIQYRRTSSFELLKKYLEEHADEWNEW